MNSGDNQFIENPISFPPPVLQIQSCLEFKLIKMSAVMTSGALFEYILLLYNVRMYRDFVRHCNQSLQLFKQHFKS
jgi:hypothetical protein